MVSFSLFDYFEVLCLACSEGYLCYVNVTVALGDHAEFFLADLLTGGGELSHSACRSSLRGLSAGVGIYFRIDNHHVHILAGSEHMVKTAESDIATPAVAAENPLALLDEHLFLVEDLLAVLYRSRPRQFVLVASEVPPH